MKDKRFNNVQMLKDNMERYHINQQEQEMLNHLGYIGEMLMQEPNDNIAYHNDTHPGKMN